MSSNFISEIETGKRWLSSDTLVNLAQALGIDVYEFLRPFQALPPDSSALLAKYTQEAASRLGEVIAESLESLRRRYSGE